MAMKKKLDISTTIMVKFEDVNQSLEGYYLGSTIIQIDGADVKKHVFQTEAGLTSVLGQAHLGQLLEGIEPGTLVRATYVSSRKLKKGVMKLYELEYDDEDRIEVGQIIHNAAPAAQETQYAEAQDDGAQAEADAVYAEEQAAQEAAAVAAAAVRRPAPPVTPTRPAAPRQPTAPTKPSTTVTADQSNRARALLSGSRPKV